MKPTTNYKFIGDEQDLLQRDFIKDDNYRDDIFYTRKCKNTDDEIIIFLKTNTYVPRTVYYNDANDEIDKEEIQDLIDDKLVVEDA